MNTLLMMRRVAITVLLCGALSGAARAQDVIVNIGVLEPGKSVTLTFDALVGDPLGSFWGIQGGVRSVRLS